MRKRTGGVYSIKESLFFLSGVYLTMLDSHGNNPVDEERLMTLKRELIIEVVTSLGTE